MRDTTPFLERYGNWKGAQPPEGFWLIGYDREDDRLAFEHSRPSMPGEVEWRPVKRLRER